VLAAFRFTASCLYEGFFVLMSLRLRLRDCLRQQGTKIGAMRLGWETP
jgi:hypothetical protein